MRSMASGRAPRRLVPWLLCAALVAPVSARAEDYLAARLGGEMDQALKAAKASRAQRTRVKASFAEAVATARAAYGDGQSFPELDELLAIFARDRIDEPAVTALKTRRAERQKVLADVLQRAFHDLHAALTPEQRGRVAAWAQARVDGKRMRRFKQLLIDGLLRVQVADLLERIGATEPERAAANTARDQVLAAVHDAQARQPAAVAELGAIFQRDAIDEAQLARFRATQEELLRSLSGTFEAALRQVHAGLGREHRMRLVEIMQARRARRARPASSGEVGF
jgi:Spy/CpxP family protein refolding chaperone